MAELFSSDGVHDKLSSLIDVKIDLLVSVESHIVRVDTLFAFLAKSLLEIRANGVGRVGIFFTITTSQVFGISIKSTEESGLLLFGFFKFFLFIEFSFKHGLGLAMVFDCICDTFDIALII